MNTPLVTKSSLDIFLNLGHKVFHLNSRGVFILMLQITSKLNFRKRLICTEWGSLLIMYGFFPFIKVQTKSEHA